MYKYVNTWQPHQTLSKKKTFGRYSISLSLLHYILHILKNVSSVHYMHKEILHTATVYILIIAKNYEHAIPDTCLKSL